jgi:S-(hydroxymethyl)glutathione dehydrogenase/alcohol dehydrogenase
MSLSIRAAVARTLNAPLVIETVELRNPGPGEVVVEMKASGMCHTDLSVIEGKFPVPLPLIPGHEGAGIVLQCGEGVTGVKPGDHVILNNAPECGVCPACRSTKTNRCKEIDTGRGRTSPFSSNGEPLGTMGGSTFASHTIVRDINLTPIDKNIPFASAALVSCGVMTGVGAVLFNAKVEAGSTVVVIGAGSIGLNVAQGARMAGASRIVMIDTQPAKEAISRMFGATDFVNPKTVNGPLEAHLASLLGGPADYAFECVGNVDLVRTALNAVHPHWGVCLAVGIAPFDQEIKLSATSFYFGRTLKGTFIGEGKPRTDTPKIIDWYREGKLHLDELVTHRLSLEEINKGFDLMKRGEAIRSVVIF